MNLGVLKIGGMVLTVIGGIASVAGGMLDQKIMSAEIAKQVAEAMAKK